jgi:anti-sigma regulatory factor (Ser/Thr protein kinase)
VSALGTLDLMLAPDPASVAEARTKVLEAMAPDLGDDTADRVRLLVSELVTNAVRHGDGGYAVELHAHWNSHIRVEVVDHGRGFIPLPRSAPSDEPGGYGLFLVGTLADRWGVETDSRTTVWFELEAVQ